MDASEVGPAGPDSMLAETPGTNAAGVRSVGGASARHRNWGPFVSGIGLLVVVLDAVASASLRMSEVGFALLLMGICLAIAGRTGQR